MKIFLFVIPLIMYMNFHQIMRDMRKKNNKIDEKNQELL
jgi:hypothetical protein